MRHSKQVRFQLVMAFSLNQACKYMNFDEIGNWRHLKAEQLKIPVLL
jgi:hypothetical protein